MKTERDIPLMDAGAGDIPYPARVKELVEHIRELKAGIVSGLAVFREALKEFSGQWMREAAKRTAIAQNTRTLALGRGEIAKLKRAIEEHLGGLEPVIGEEFTLEKYGDAAPASSGQVSALVERRFERGIRTVLATLGPVLERAGYVRDEHWVDAEAPEGQRGRYPYVLELPPDLSDLISKVAEAITDVKVAEAKIAYFDKQRDKELAAELWDRS